MYNNDKRIVITLDAGGTNFVFGAMQANKFVVEPITLPSQADNLDNCLAAMVRGFQTIIDKLAEKPVAISFAFPGPADYPRGIIGGYLPNFPSFRDGVALGDFLNEKFGLPVYINNDADLYAYGEALAGALPEINTRLAKSGSAKQYENLLGYTFGTGFGFGQVSGGKLHGGDNSCVETYCLPNKKYPQYIVEDSVAIRAIKRVYAELSGDKNENLTPKDIFDIAEKTREGNADAAKKSFAEFGDIAGDAIVTAATLIDGLVVIGGGLIGAKKYIIPSLLAAMRGTLKTMSGDTVNRLQCSVFDLDDDAQFELFAKGNSRQLKVYGSNKIVTYDPMKRIGVCTTKIGASRAISLGAYAFALNKLDKS